jgi:hypothetical protein
MEKVIEEPTYVKITDKEGNPLLARSLLDAKSKVVYDEITGVVNVLSPKGDTVWHSRIASDSKIEYELKEVEE